MGGLFIAVEGVDGSGKSTVAQRLADNLRLYGLDVMLTREPGGTAVGERIRDVLLAPGSENLTAETEALLFAAARAQLVREVLRPAIELGRMVIIDRFADSSLAYQSGGRGLPLAQIRQIQDFATDGMSPDLKLLLDVQPEVSLRRRRQRHNETNRLDHEALEFHTRVRESYLNLAADQPEKWRIIDASKSSDQVWHEVWRNVIESGIVKELRGSEPDVAQPRVSA